MEILPAQSDQAAEIAALLIEARRAAVPAIPASIHTDQETQEWVASELLPNNDIWIAVSRGTIVAVLATTMGWIEQLYCKPGFTGLGIGSQLLQHAKEHSDGQLDLWTFVSNVGAQRFYERHGFVEIARTDGDNEEGAPDIRYRWTASPQTPKDLAR